LRGRGVKRADTLPPLGIMVEMPAAALTADALAAESDFFAIGSNDLTMYTLAADRADTDAAEIYTPLHPAVLRMIQMTVEAGGRRGIPVSICGEMASQALITPLLLGLGVRSFSMNATAVPRVKQAVRSAVLADCAALAADIMQQGEPEAIAEKLRLFNERR
jgi:phosphotransferase system enzyme I (PtsI)